MNEAQNRLRLADQMITAYSVLRDRYDRRATYLTLAIFFASVVLCACTFLSEETLSKVGLSPGIVTLVIGIASSVVLFASIAELCVSWKEKSKEYGLAADKLAEFKTCFRGQSGMAIANTDEETEKASALAYQEAIRDLPRIPDVQFVTLKAFHLKKIQLSKMADDNIG